MPEVRPIRSLGLVVPVHNEKAGLPILFQALKDFQATLADLAIRVVFVDDHSTDATPNLLRKACADTPWFSFLRLSTWAGSHTAIVAGLDQCREDCAVFLAADLQTPLTLLPAMIDLCRQGRDVVWGSYESNENQGRSEMLTSRLFHAIMQRISSVGELPFQPGFAMLSRRAYTNLVRNCSRRASLIVEIPRLGYSVATLTYKKPKRVAGTSKWTLSRKLLVFLDAIVAASYLPLRAMAAIGTSVSLLGFGYAVFLIGMSLLGRASPLGWRSLMVVVLVLGGLQMLMLGIIGEYLWRVTETASRRPLYLIEDSSGLPVRDHVIQ